MAYIREDGRFVYLPPKRESQRHLQPGGDCWLRSGMFYEDFEYVLDGVVQAKFETHDEARRALPLTQWR